MEIIKAEGIHVSYRDKEVISDLNVGIKKGTVVSIIGPNGSGKTTILKVLSKNIKPDKGRIFLDDRDISTIRAKKNGTTDGSIDTDALLPEGYYCKAIGNIWTFCS